MTDDSYRIEGTDSRGWHRNRYNIYYDYRRVRLRRDDSVASGGRAVEGVFTCNILGDINTPISVGIYYPSESHVQSFIFTTQLYILLLFSTLPLNLFSNNYYHFIPFCDAKYSIHSWTQSHQWTSQSMCCHQDKEHSQ